MAIERNLSIFISWSGVLALECTKALREWLPKMFDHIDPWASDTDIEAGDRSMDEIKDKLNESGFGIIVVTTENMAKPWLNFEAGALSKSFGDDKNRVVPLLVNFKNKYQLKGPIDQFHAIMLNKEGMGKLCDSIGVTIGLDRPTVRARFEWAWPSLESAIETAKDVAGDQPELPDVDEKELLKNVYSMVRAIQEQQQARPDERASAPKIGTVGSSLEYRPPPFVNMREVLRAATVAASEFEPIESVEIDRRDGEFVISVSLKDGARLSRADRAKLHRKLAEITPFRAVIA